MPDDAADLTPSDPPAPELLRAKLTPPPAGPRLVPRARLLDALDDPDAALVLIDAPAGYGKTSLLAAWSERATARGQAVVWFSLDGADNDPALLTRYLVEALRPLGPLVGQRAVALARISGGDPSTWITSLLNDLAALDGEATLVLDDVHELSDPVCQTLVAHLARSAPPALRIIIASRSQLPAAFHVPALRAGGRFKEIRASDLRFTDGEGGALLRRSGATPSEALVADLVARTEGWGAGLYLASLQLSRTQADGGPGSASPAAAEHADAGVGFAGDHREVAAYLQHVVLDQLPEETRAFLLHTSVVERFTAPLCEALTGRPAVTMLEELQRANLFVVSLDATGTWFRFHALFGQMLRAELQRTEPELAATLHARASAWHLDRGDYDEAVQQAVSAGDLDAAADVICEHWIDVGRWGQEATIKRWLSAFDPTDIARYPELGLIGAILTGVSGGDERELHAWHELAESRPTDAGPDARRVSGMTSYDSGLGLLRSTFGYRDVGAAATEAAHTVRLETEGRGQLRVAALANLSFLLFVLGDGDAARATAEQAVRPPQGPRRPHGYILALSVSALVRLDEGDADEGTRLHLVARAGSLDTLAAIDATDAGPGFPPEFVDHAFDRFSQADPSHTGSGTGLGLAIVAAIAAAHRGATTISAQGDRGSTVTVELPLA